jgi:eukaryotic-like serine/threonine-protein kinase
MLGSFSGDLEPPFPMTLVSAPPERSTMGLRTLGRYELIHRIAVGGMAEVFLARQRGFMNFRKLVVVKTIHPSLADDPDFIKMLLDEARIAALIKHPRVVDIYDLGREDDIYFIAMEYLPGKPLNDVIRAGLKKRKLDVHSVARVIADAADALQAAHELKAHTGERLDFVHRDVSPGNIILLYDGQVKLVDFGVSKARGRMQRTAVQSVKGKLGYAAPEQLDPGRADRRSDVFSLGVCMWELLTHRRLFQADTVEAAMKLMKESRRRPPSLLRADVPRELDEICLRAIQIAPDERYQTAAEMLKQLEEFLRVENYYRESKALAKYMEEMFVAEREKEEELVRRVAEATTQVQLSDLEPTDLHRVAPPDRADTDVETDEHPGPDDGPTRKVQTPELVRQTGPRNALRPPGAVIAGRSLLEPAPPAPAAPRAPAAPPAAPAPPASPIAAVPRVSIELLEDSPSDITAVEEMPDDTMVIRHPETVDGTAIVEPLADDRSRRRRRLWAAGGVVAVAGIAAVLAATSGGDLPPTDQTSLVSVPSVEPEPTPTPPAESELLSALDPVEEPPTPPSESEEPPAIDEPPPPSEEEPPETSRERPDELEEDDSGDPGAAGTRRERERERRERRTRARAIYDEGARLYLSDPARAQQRFQEALRVDRGLAIAHRGLGLVHQRQGRAAQAIRSFRTYLRMAPRARDAEDIRKRIQALGG